MYSSKIKSLVKIPKQKREIDEWGKLDPIYEKAIMDEKQDLSYRANVANSNSKQYHDFVVTNPKIDQNTLPKDYREMRSEADNEADEMYQREILIKNCSRLFPNNLSRGNELIQVILDKNYSKYFNKFFAKIFRILNSDYGNNFFPSDVINVIQQEMLKDDKTEIELDLVLNPKSRKQDIMNEPLSSGVFITVLQTIYTELNALIANSNNQTTAMQNILIDSRNKAIALEATIGTMVNNMMTQPAPSKSTPMVASNESKTDTLKEQAKKVMDSAINQLTPKKSNPVAAAPSKSNQPSAAPSKSNQPSAAPLKSKKQASAAPKTPDPVLQVLTETIGTTPKELLQNLTAFNDVLSAGQIPVQPLLSGINQPDLEKSISKSRASTDFIYNYEACLNMQSKISGFTPAIMKRTLNTMFGFDSSQLPDGRSNDGKEQIRAILQDKVDEYIVSNRVEYEQLKKGTI